MMFFILFFISLSLFSLAPHSVSDTYLSTPSLVEKTQHLITTLDFNKNRNFFDYAYFFGSPFLRIISSLSNTDIWLDSGSGHCISVQEYLTDPQISQRILRILETSATPYFSLKLENYIYHYIEFHPFIEDNDNDFANIFCITRDLTDTEIDNIQNKFPSCAISNHFAEQIPLSFIQSFHAQISIITDLHGVHQYTWNPSFIFWMYQQLLIPEGFLFLFFSDTDKVIVDSSTPIPYKTWLQRKSPFAIISLIESSLGIYVLMTNTNPMKEIPFLELISTDSSRTPPYPPQRIFIERPYPFEFTIPQSA